MRWMLAPVFLIAACGPAEPIVPPAPEICGDPSTYDEFVPGLTKTSSGGTYEVALVTANPDPPGTNFNVWSLDLGRDDVELRFQPWMPAHEHGPRESGASVEAGEYVTENLDFFMPGLWETTITIIDPGNVDDGENVVFNFCAQ